MKSNTEVHIAIRNIGDANDAGEFFEGDLKSGIMWLAAALGTKVMAKRIAIGIGRDKAGASAAIELKRSTAGGLTDELSGALDALLDGDSPEDVLASVAEGAASASPLDTWKGATL